jgi:hypothetical protein
MTKSRYEHIAGAKRQTITLRQRTLIERDAAFERMCSHSRTCLRCANNSAVHSKESRLKLGSSGS